MYDDGIMYHDPASLCPAPGWRAVYLQDEEEPGWSAEPLVGWVVYKTYWHRDASYDNPADGEYRGSEIHGVTVSEGDYFDRASSMVNFWKYLPPGEPDPTPQEAAAERRQRYQVSLHPATVTHAGFGLTEQRLWGWHIRARLGKNGQGREITSDIVINTDLPASLLTVFRQLHVLGVPVGPPHGPEGEQPFWAAYPIPPGATDEQQRQAVAAAGQAAAQMMPGRRVVLRHLGGQLWSVEKTPDEAGLVTQTSP